MSRNRERSGGVQQHDSSPPPQMMQNEGAAPFSFVVPTEFVELPSQGKFYPEGHPLTGQDSIEIRQMTAKEEDMLTSRTLLKKGVALDRVIENVIVNKTIDPDSLLIGDRNAIIIALRVSGYGNDYDTQITCPACNVNQNYSFDLNTADIYHGESTSDSIQTTYNDDGTFTTVLPKTQVNVAFKLLTGRDERKMLEGIESDRRQKIHERSVTRQIINMVTSVNDDSSAGAINYLVQNIPSTDSRHLRLAYKLVAPNLDLIEYFECSECMHSQDLEVPLTADFFWPDR